METPERNHIGSSVSKYEDSPVFNYLSNLSPIKTVKSAPIAQTFTSLNFNSIPSVFTSPHVISHKESRFVKRQKTPDKSQPDISYVDVDANKENEVFVDVNQLHNYTSELYEKSGPVDSHGEAVFKPFKESSHPMEICPESPSMAHMLSGEDASLSAEAVTSSCKFDQGPSTSVPAMHEGQSGWESLVSDGADLLMFDSPSIFKDLNALFKSPPLERAGPSLAQQFPQNSPDFLKSDPALEVNISELQNESHCLETEGNNCGHSEYSNTMTHCTTSNPVGTSNDEPMTSLHRGVMRRCLVFDTKRARAQSENLTTASTSNPSICRLLDQRTSSYNRKREAYNTSSLRVLPGIGLHLNTIAVSEDRTLGAQTKVSSSIASFPSPIPEQEKESFDEILTGALSEKNVDSDIVHRDEDASLDLDLVVSTDDFNQNSPQHKRHKQENSGDGSCKHCNCKKSKCLKLYCECFAAGVFCTGTCACQDCMNRPGHKQTILSTRKQIESRNPLAFAPKVVVTSDPHPDIKDEIMSTPASARHKRGCNCKKSGCQKKYCECYQSGVGCSLNCRCEGCKNMFGTKDGKGLAPVAQDYDDDYEVQTQKAKKKMNNKCPQKILSQNNEEHDANTFPETPLHLSRMSGQVPFSSKDKPPRSSLFRKPNHFNPPPGRNHHPVGEDITDEHESMKTTSPNSNNSSLCGRRSTRKLMLQSIPAFPSLTQP